MRGISHLTRHAGSCATTRALHFTTFRRLSTRRVALMSPAKWLLRSQRIFRRVFKMYYSHLARTYISD